MKYTLFHGAKKNVGDFLIYHRAKNLLNEYAGISDDEIYELDMVREELSPEQIKKISNTDAVIIAGDRHIMKIFIQACTRHWMIYLTRAFLYIRLALDGRGRQKKNIALLVNQFKCLNGFTN
ncbi:hypothetical protein [Halonotius sp. GCM10025705]|uniref:hypothetical protein n=1 Tax=Halonotius sp. GCM10025705 TaxID=3252678 RepID=UPI0036186ACD